MTAIATIGWWKAISVVAVCDRSMRLPTPLTLKLTKGKDTATINATNEANASAILR
jgi:hypothetical protein